MFSEKKLESRMEVKDGCTLIWLRLREYAKSLVWVANLTLSGKGWKPDYQLSWKLIALCSNRLSFPIFQAVTRIRISLTWESKEKPPSKSHPPTKKWPWKKEMESSSKVDSRAKQSSSKTLVLKMPNCEYSVTEVVLYLFTRLTRPMPFYAAWSST